MEQGMAISSLIADRQAIVTTEEAKARTRPPRHHIPITYLSLRGAMCRSTTIRLATSTLTTLAPPETKREDHQTSGRT